MTAPTTPRRRGPKAAAARAPWLLLAPFLVLFLLTFILPILTAVGSSFTKVTRAGLFGEQGVSTDFAWFANYAQALGDANDALTDPHARARVGVRPRHEDEGALIRPRVGQEERRVVTADLVGAARRAVLDQVQVERALTPAHRAHAAVSRLDPVQRGQQVGGGQLGVPDERGVEVVGLLRATDRVGLDELGDRINAHARGGPKFLDSGAQGRDPVT